MKNIIRLTESDLTRIVKKVISEQESNKTYVTETDQIIKGPKDRPVDIFLPKGTKFLYHGGRTITCIVPDQGTFSSSREYNGFQLEYHCGEITFFHLDNLKNKNQHYIYEGKNDYLLKKLTSFFCKSIPLLSSYGDNLGYATSTGLLVKGDDDGNGVLKWTDAKYYGELKHGRMTGKGTLNIDYGGGYKIYVKGHFDWDKFNGPIEYKDSDGETFKGNYKDGYKYGYGIETWSNGTTFKGNYKDGYKNGYGEFKFSNGGTLKGNFKDDAINGYGIETWSDGSTYKGNYKDGYKHGHGEVKFVNGATYKGNFKDDFWGGYGIYTNPHGIKFEGNFKDGYINGKTTEDLDKIKTQPKAVVKQKSKTIKLPKLSPDQICTLEKDKRWSYAKTTDGKWYASKDKVNWYDISSNKKATSILNADGACKSISKIPINPVEPSTDSKETFIPTDDIEFGNEKIPNWIVPFYK